MFPHVLGRLGHGVDSGFESAHISRRHAEISESGSSLLIRDLGSANGAFVNGQRIDGSGIVLNSYDLIKLGDGVVVLRFVRDDATVIQGPSHFSSGPVQIDQGTGDVRVDGKMVSSPLPRNAFDVLTLLASAGAQYHGRDDVARAGWPDLQPFQVTDGMIQQTISKLRPRVRPHRIENRRNFGYRLV